MTMTEPLPGTIETLDPGAIGAKPADEIGFDDLIAPVGRERFFAEYWEKKPLVTRGRPHDFFVPVFSLRDVDRAICYVKPKPGRIDLVTAEGFVRDNFLGPDGTANVNLVRESYLKGSTVILSGLEENWEPLAVLNRRLESELSHPVATAVYLTPPGFKGVKPHFDTQENLLLQVQGTKAWKVFEPPQELPPVEGSYVPVPAETLGEPILETVLEPGDVLYLPRGFAHYAVARDEPSLHVTLDVHVRTWHDLLSDTLDALAEREPALRSALPAGFLNDPDALTALEARFGEVLDRLRSGARFDDAIGKHFEALAVRKPPLPDGHFADLFVEIGPDTRLERRPGTLLRLFGSNGYAGLQFSGNQIVGPAKIAEALRHVAEHPSLTPASLPGPLNEKEKLVLARRMVRIGLLGIA